MVSELVNLTKFPLDQPDSGRYRSLIERYKGQLAAGSLLNMDDFLTPSGTTRLMREVESLAPGAFHTTKKSSPYGLVDTRGLAADHPYRIQGETDRHGLGRHDLLGTALDELYAWPPVREFVRDLLGLDSIYLHADPSNALVAQIYKPGGGLAWHFDRAHFSTILNLSESERGGVFECVPNIRTQDDPRFDEVRDVLLDRSERVKRNHPRAGSFTIILGRYTLHRVTQVRGDRSRISAVLSYEDKPGVRLDRPTRRLFFGPTAPAD